MAPRLVLCVGSRGTRIADMVDPLTRLADVVVVTSDEAMRERADSLDGAASAVHVERVRRRFEVASAVVEYAASHPVDGVLSLSEDTVEAAALAAAALDLPGQPPLTIARFRDKYVQRETLRAAGVPTPSYVRVRSPRQAAEVASAVQLPAIVKPARGSGSALTYRVSDEHELPAVLASAFTARALAGGAVDEDTDFVVESLFTGVDSHPVDGFAPYVSVETVAAGGELTHLCVTDRFPLAPPFLETGMMLPSCLDGATRRSVLEMADRALRALEFAQGVAHTELMLTAAGPRVIEVNARPGGAIPYLLPMALGTDVVVQAGRAALGRSPEPSGNGTGYAVFVGPQHRVDADVVGVDGLDDVAALPSVRAVIPVAVDGVSTTGYRNTLIAAVLATATDPADAVETWRSVMSLVRPRYAREPA